LRQPLFLVLFDRKQERSGRFYVDRSRRHHYDEFGGAARHVNRLKPHNIARLMLCVLLAAGSWMADAAPSEERRSGYTYLSKETRRLQDDDFANPGMLWVE